MGESLTIKLLDILSGFFLKGACGPIKDLAVLHSQGSGFANWLKPGNWFVD